MASAAQEAAGKTLGPCWRGLGSLGWRRQALQPPAAADVPQLRGAAQRALLAQECRRANAPCVHGRPASLALCSLFGRGRSQRHPACQQRCAAHWRSVAWRRPRGVHRCAVRAALRQEARRWKTLQGLRGAAWHVLPVWRWVDGSHLESSGARAQRAGSHWDAHGERARTALVSLWPAAAGVLQRMGGVVRRVAN